MKHFRELKFEPRERVPGMQALIFFPNGYGASVISGPYTYGGPEGLYELAVIKGGPDTFDLCYDTPITEDVLGYLSEDDVTRLLNEIYLLRTYEGTEAE